MYTFHEITKYTAGWRQLLILHSLNDIIYYLKWPTLQNCKRARAEETEKNLLGQPPHA
jgi:hypothetical protein